MKIIHQIKELRHALSAHMKKNETIGLVPTMGALHRGHVSLIEESIRLADITVVTIFVNPTQFGPHEDFAAYPRTLDEDAKICEVAEVDYIFAPSAEEMYHNPLSYVSIDQMHNALCGASRPGHFRGVCTVVMKLFNIVQPNLAFFGKKDIQQLLILQKMVEDLNIPVEIIPCPIMREDDGLALSSRNRYLTTNERQKALVLNQALKKAGMDIKKGEKSSQNIINMITTMIERETKIDYVEIVDQTINHMEEISEGCIVAIAAFVGSTRLIDNYLVGDPLW